MAKSEITVELVGLPQALAGLSQFSKAVRTKVTRNAVSAGAGLLRDAASMRAPVETKLLKQNMRVRLLIPKNDSGIFTKIGAKKKVKKAVYINDKGATKLLTGKKLKLADAAGAKKVFRSPSRYLHLVHGGTKSHAITAKNVKVLARSGRILGTTVTVQAKANPFLEATARSEGPKATARSLGKIQQGIRVEAAKAATKSVVKAVRKSDR